MFLPNWLYRFFSRGHYSQRPGRKSTRTVLHVEDLEVRRAPAVAVWTTLADYAPGDTAVIQGSGFTPGEAVRLIVERNDGPPISGPGSEPWQIQDGGAGDLDGQRDGNILTRWFVNEQFLGAQLDLRAEGQSSGQIAIGKFATATSNKITTLGVTNLDPPGDVNLLLSFTLKSSQNDPFTQANISYAGNSPAHV